MTTSQVRLYHDTDPVTLVSGSVLAPVTVAYETYGELAEDGSNAVFVCHALTGDAHVARHHAHDRPGWWEHLVGPGRPIDTDRYFVVCANVLGGCSGTTGPCSTDAAGRRYGLDFPSVQIADMVTVHRRLISHLGITRLRAVVGGSLGGMQALEWLMSAPDSADAFLLMATTGEMSTENLAWNAIARAAIRSDPEFGDGHYPLGGGPRAGLGLARMIGHVTYLNEEALQAKFGRTAREPAGTAPVRGGFAVEAYLEHQAVKLVDRFDANSYLYLLDAMDRFAPFAGGRMPLPAGEAPQVHVFSLHGDRLFGEEHSLRLCRRLADAGMAARHHHDPHASGGHDAFLLDTPGFLHQVSQVFEQLPEVASRGSAGHAERRRPSTDSGVPMNSRLPEPFTGETAAAALPPLLLVINRFDDEFGEYHRFLRDTEHRLAYLTTADALAPLDQDGAVETVVLPDLSYGALLSAARDIAAKHGRFAAIVGLSEFDLNTAALLRADFGVPGWSVAYTNMFRDKTLMKHRIHRAGLRAPGYREIGAGSDPSLLVADLGLPLILKPRDGAGSRGVTLVRTEEELAKALTEVDGRQEYEAEEYVEGAIHHVDGIRRAGRFHFVSVSRYVNNCLEFTQGVPLGSVLLDPGPRRDALVAFAADCLDAMDLRDGPFHLEAIVTASGEPVFLEVGLRPGGAGVPFLHRDLFGIDLYEEAFRATLGLPPLTAGQDLRARSSGAWLIFPEPRPWPRRVTGRTSLAGSVPEVYAESLPEPGHVFDGNGGYDHAGGRFLLRGADEELVREAVLKAISLYALETEPTDEP